MNKKRGPSYWWRITSPQLPDTKEYCRSYCITHALRRALHLMGDKYHPISSHKYIFVTVTGHGLTLKGIVFFDRIFHHYQFKDETLGVILPTQNYTGEIDIDFPILPIPMYNSKYLRYRFFYDKHMSQP